jgi:hypothetical protein
LCSDFDSDRGIAAPTIVFFIMLQRRFIDGIASGAVESWCVRRSVQPPLAVDVDEGVGADV